MRTANVEPARCEHVALVHSGIDDMSRRLAPSLRRAADEGAAVLMCLDDEATARVRADMGSATDAFTFLPVDSRYASPAVAMAGLHSFFADAMSSGATTAWSIGAVPVTGDGNNGRWMRYERAVAEVFADRALRAVCLYDAAATPFSVRATIGESHHSVDGAWHPQDGDGEVDDVQALYELTPARKPDALVQPASPREARAVVDRLLGSTVPESTLMDLRLVVSELATNALMHGTLPIEVRLWREPSTCVVQVHDAGATAIDPFADLRARAGGSHGGFGLWTVGQLADDVLIANDDHGNTVTAILTLARP